MLLDLVHEEECSCFGLCKRTFTEQKDGTYAVFLSSSDASFSSDASMICEEYKKKDSPAIYYYGKDCCFPLLAREYLVA